MRLFRPAAPRLAPGDLIEVEGRPVRLRVHGRARRVSLRLDVASREVIATAPNARRLSEAAAFAKSRAGWIAARLDSLPSGAGFAPGVVIQVNGAPLRLERAAMRVAPRVIPARDGEPARLVAYGEGATYARAVERALKAEALRVLTERTAVHVAALRAPMPKVAVMDARARWGSCKPPSSIRYVWRLIAAPPFVLDYVVAHEVAHLRECNHSSRFWAEVDGLYGDPSEARAWLRRHGPTLHALGRS